MYISCCLCIIFRVGYAKISRRKGRFQWNMGLIVYIVPRVICSIFQKTLFSSSWWLEFYGWRPWILTLIPTSSPILGRLKPIFHWILGLRWLPNANKMDTNNMKSTLQRENFALGTQRHLYTTCWHWGLALGVKQMLVFTLGVTQFLAFLDTNMLLSPMQNCGGGGLSQCQL